MVRCNEHPSKWEAGGKFDGNHVKKLLNSIDRLDSMLIEAKVSVKCLNETVALDSFKRVTDKCFGMLLQDGWEEAIEQFSADFRYLDKEIPLKVHILEIHVPQFLNRKQADYPGKGLGFFNEQSSESVHHDWDALWVGNKYKRELKDKDYDSQLKKCGTTYNARHM